MAGMYRAARMHQSRERCSALSGRNTAASALRRIRGALGLSGVARTGLRSAEGAQLRVSKRRISVVRDAGGRSAVRRVCARSRRQASLRNACSLPAATDQIGGQMSITQERQFQGGCECFFTRDRRARRSRKMTRVQCGGGYGQQPTVAQCVACYPCRTWMLDAGCRIIRWIVD